MPMASFSIEADYAMGWKDIGKNALIEEHDFHHLRVSYYEMKKIVAVNEKGVLGGGKKGSKIVPIFASRH